MYTVPTSIQIVCKYNHSMQHLHPLKHSAALQGAVTEEGLNFIADPEIQSLGTFAGELEREAEDKNEKIEGKRELLGV